MNDVNNELLAICKRLYDVIEEKGVSYGELAAATGIPKSAIHRYATGETLKIPLDRIKALADALGVTAAYIMGWEDNHDSSSANTELPEEEYLLAARSKDGKQAVRKLTKKQYEIAKSVIESLELNEDENL